MSWVSQAYKKVVKPIKRPLGKALDFAGDYLPPGWRDAANFAGKRMQGQSTRQAAVGAAMDYAGGRVMKGVQRKIGGIGKVGGSLDAANAAGDAATNAVMNATKDVGRNAMPDLLQEALRRGGGGGIADSITAMRRKVGIPPITAGNVARGVTAAAGGRNGGNGGGDGEDLPWWKDALNYGKDAVGYAKDNALDIGMLGLATTQGINAAKQRARANELSDKSLRHAEDRWAGGQAFRDMGRTGLLTPAARPDLSDIYTNPQNVFARKRKLAGVS